MYLYKSPSHFSWILSSSRIRTRIKSKIEIGFGIGTSSYSTSSSPFIARRQYQQQLGYLLNHSRLFSTSTYNLPNLPLFRNLRNHDPSNTAIVHSATTRSFSYGDLLVDVSEAKDELERTTGELTGQRVGFLAENSYDYVGTVSSPLILPLT